MERILDFLLDNDKETREQANSQLNELKNRNSDEFLEELMKSFKTLEEEEKRLLVLSLLKQNLPFLWESLPDHLKNWIKCELLNCASLTSTWKLSKYLSSTISDLATFIIQSGTGEKWSNFLTFLISSIQSENQYTKFISFLVLSEIIPFYYDTFSKFRRKLIPLYVKNLDHPQAELRFSAIHSLTVYISVINSSEANQYAETLRPLLNSVLYLCTSSTEEAKSSLKSLIELAESDPVYFKQDISLLASFMEKVRKDCQSIQIRVLVIELIVNVVELNVGFLIDKREFLMALVHLILEDLVTASPGIMLGPDDSVQRVLLSHMMRVVRSVGESIVEYLLRISEKVLQDRTNEGQVFVANLVLSEIAEFVVGSEYFELVLSAVESSVDDLRPALRWAALRVLGKLLKIQNEDLQSKISLPVFTVLKKGIRDNDLSVVRKVIKVLRRFLETAGKEVCKSYSEELMPLVVEKVVAGSHLTRTLDLVTILCCKCRLNLTHYFYEVFGKLQDLMEVVTVDEKFGIFDCMLALRKIMKKEEFLGLAGKYVFYLENLGKVSIESPQILKPFILFSKSFKSSICPYLTSLTPIVTTRLLDPVQTEDSLQCILSLIDSTKSSFLPYCPGILDLIENFIISNPDDLNFSLLCNVVSAIFALDYETNSNNLTLSTQLKLQKFVSMFWNWAESETDLALTCEILSKIKKMLEMNENLSLDEVNSCGKGFIKVLQHQKVIAQGKEKGFADHAIGEITEGFFKDVRPGLVPVLEGVYKLVLGKLGSQKLNESDTLFAFVMFKNVLRHIASFLSDSLIRDLLTKIEQFCKFPQYQIQKSSILLLQILFIHLSKSQFQSHAASLLSQAESILRPIQDSRRLLDLKLKDLCAISISHLIRSKHDCVSLELLIPWWISFLPLTSHKKHAQDLHDLLADLTLHLPFLASNEKILTILLTVSFTDFCSPSTLAKLKKIIECQPAPCLSPVLSSKLIKLQTL